ncbi:MAG TPA: type II toxin-antitoxin system VapC family toxin [Candidatus Nanoarchaeia archaeon]|nr:type II toxin-antitoxin system VapC family toxin [Candidatus Nanoarchaeia archaeon]
MICLDSDFLIDFLNDKKEAVEFLIKYHGDFVTTEINLFEVFDGIYYQKQVNKKEEELAKSFFKTLPTLSSQNGWGQAAAYLLSYLRKQGKEIEDKDCFIAAIMQVHGCSKIITRNVKHYSSIPGIQVISY